MKLPGPKGSNRPVENLGPIPQPIEQEDTDPTLFETADVTPVVCSLCRRSPYDSDDAFERGIDYALVRLQGMCQSIMHADDARHMVDWLRQRIKNP